MPVEWGDIEFELHSPVGELDFNVATTIPFKSGDGFIFLLDQEACAASAGPLRSNNKPQPQAPGSILEPGYLNGVGASLAIEFWIASATADAGQEPACGSDLQAMWDTLMLHAQALVSPSVLDLFSENCRLKWLPTGAGDKRMLVRLQATGWPVLAKSGRLGSTVLGLTSWLPYEMNATEQTVTLIPMGSGGPEMSCFNAGSCPCYPTFRVHGPATAFTITNVTTGEAIFYDDSLPGAHSLAGGHYIEIDTARQTVYLDGDVADRLAGIDIPSTSFFTLEPGDNELELTGDAASCDVLFNNTFGV